MIIVLSLTYINSELGIWLMKEDTYSYVGGKPHSAKTVKDGSYYQEMVKSLGRKSYPYFSRTEIRFLVDV